MDHLTASLKVLYDKVIQYITPNVSNDTTPTTPTTPTTIITSDISSSNIIIENEPSFIDCSTSDIDPVTNLCNQNDRLFKKIPYLTQLKWFFNEPTYITKNIYLGSSHNAANKKLLDDKNIKYIINVTNEIDNYYPTDITYINYKLNDNNAEHIIHHLEDSYKKIKQFQSNNNGNILVHCFMGASRSATIVAYYLIRENNIEPLDAYLYLKEKRDLVNPTILFYKDLTKSIKNNKKIIN
jgi:protein-tyrosine phosphatase